MRPGIIEARARYRTAARRLRNTDLSYGLAGRDAARSGSRLATLQRNQASTEYGASRFPQNVRNNYVNENLKYQTLPFSPTLCYFLFLDSKCSSQHLAQTPAVYEHVTGMKCCFRSAPSSEPLYSSAYFNPNICYRVREDKNSDWKAANIPRI